MSKLVSNVPVCACCGKAPGTLCVLKVRDLGYTPFCQECGIHANWTHTWGWRIRPTDKDRMGMGCKLVQTGAKGSALILFEDGAMIVTSRRGLRKLKDDLPF